MNQERKEGIIVVAVLVAVMLALSGLVVWALYQDTPPTIDPTEPVPEPFVTTQAEMNDYAVDLLYPCFYDGDNETIEWRFQTTNDFPLPAMNFTPEGRVYYGYPATTLREIAERTPKSGRQVWRVIVDPNNGWVQELVCDYTQKEGCPKDPDGNWTWIRESPYDNPDTEEYQALPYQRKPGVDSMIITFIAFAECDSILEWFPE